MGDVAEAGQVMLQLTRRQAHDIAARAREDAEALARAGFSCAGRALADVLLVKGELSDEELAGGELLAGPDGDALRAALRALGYPEGDWAAVSSCVWRSPGEGGGLPAGGAAASACGAAWDRVDPADLAWAVEAVDPELVVALDGEAARALAGALGMGEPPAPGSVGLAAGRRVLCLGGFAASLSDQRAKRVMWDRLKLVPPLGEPL